MQDRVRSINAENEVGIAAASKIADHTFLRQGLVLLFRELDRIAAGRRILDRHGRHFIQALGVNADVLQRVRNANLLAQRQNPFEETH